MIAAIIVNDIEQKKIYIENLSINKVKQNRINIRKFKSGRNVVDHIKRILCIQHLTSCQENYKLNMSHWVIYYTQWISMNIKSVNNWYKKEPRSSRQLLKTIWYCYKRERRNNLAWQARRLTVIDRLQPHSISPNNFASSSSISYKSDNKHDIEW